MGGPVIIARRSTTRGITAVLALTGLIAGAELVSPLCYWQGRTFGAGSRYVGLLPNWRPELAPWYGLTLVLAIAWVVAWFLHARRTWAPRQRAHSIVPAATFLFSALQLSSNTMACGAY